MFEHCSVIGLEENHTKTHRVQGINVVGEMLREGLEKTKGTERERGPKVAGGTEPRQI